MAGIYCADIYCDACTEDIKSDIRADDRVKQLIAGGADLDDETTFDSDEYPKYCSDSSESDSPQHCGDCGVFLENDLTSDGEDYVKQAVRDDLMSGRTDSVAVTEWMEYYTWIDFEYKECGICGNWCDSVNDFDECDECSEEEV
jgi:hypothetical protein